MYLKIIFALLILQTHRARGKQTVQSSSLSKAKLTILIIGGEVMRKHELLLLVFCLSVLGIIFGNPAWAGVYLDEGKTFYFSAKAESRVSIRTEDSEGYTFVEVDQGDAVQFRNLLYLQADHNLEGVQPLGLKMKYHLLGRFFYEGIYDYGPSQFQELQDLEGSVIEDFKKDADLWEGYFDVSKGPFFLRAGKQNLSWGETDVFRLSDMINPLDNTYGGIFENLDDRRIPLTMI